VEKLQRNERIALQLKLLSDAPCKVFQLGEFCEMFGAAKSTISEDIAIIERLLERFGIGKVETIPGASGGVRYIPFLSKERIWNILKSLSSELSNKDRILPGGFVYMLDIIFNPEKVSQIGQIFATYFFSKKIDYVITVETKGIPLALATAKNLNVPLVIVRHYNEAADGASVNINYVSGSSKRMQTMVLSLKALKRNSKLLFIDDFMKGGGTAKGILELAREFECEVTGIGVFIATSEPKEKLVNDYLHLLTLNKVEEKEEIIDIQPYSFFSVPE